MLFVQVCLGVCMRLSVIHSEEISNNSECFPVWPWIHFDNEAKIKIKTRESVRVILHKMHGENNNKPSSLETFHTKREYYYRFTQNKWRWRSPLFCSFLAKAVTSQLTHQLFCISKIDAADKLYGYWSCVCVCMCAPVNKWREQKNREKIEKENKIIMRPWKCITCVCVCDCVCKRDQIDSHSCFRMTRECHCRNSNIKYGSSMHALCNVQCATKEVPFCHIHFEIAVSHIYSYVVSVGNAKLASICHCG